MKKICVIIASIVILVCIAVFTYETVEKKYIDIKRYNNQIEEHLSQTMTSTDVVELINFVWDTNKINNVKYDEDGFSNSENALKLYLDLLDEDGTYFTELTDSESIYLDGVDRFKVYYEEQKFKLDNTTKDDQGKINSIIIKEIP